MANNTNKTKRNGKKTTRTKNYRSEQRCAHNDRSDGADMTLSSSNDASWYAQNPQLLRDAASFAYSWALGNDVNFKGVGTTEDMKPEAVPGVVVLDITPTIGYSDQPNSAVNVAARNIYSYVRHANSGHSNYDAPDLMMYILAMDSAYALWAAMRRVYGVSRLYSAANRYYAKTLVTALGFDYDDLLLHLSDFRTMINTFAYKLGSLCIPASMSYLARHMWLNSGIYVDSDSAKAQTYVFRQASCFQFSENETVGEPGKLKLIDIFKNDGSVLTVAEVRDTMNKLLDPILSSEDMNIMSGDILKAFSENGVFKVTTTPEDYVVLPSYDKEVLSQIQNSTIWEDSFMHPRAFDVTQDVKTGALISKPTIQIPASAVNPLFRRVVNMYKDEVEPGDTMVATRLLSMASRPTSGDNWDLRTVGSEFVARARVFFLSNGIPQSAPFSSILEVSDLVSANEAGLFRSMLLLEDFKMHPIQYVFYGGMETTKKRQFCHWHGDLNNYALMDASDIQKMNDVALLSEFSCPQMGSAQNKF